MRHICYNLQFYNLNNDSQSSEYPISYKPYRKNIIVILNITYE